MTTTMQRRGTPASDMMWDGLTPPYRTIVADPPWAYPEGFPTQSRTPGSWSGAVETRPLPYSALSVEDIRSLSVRDLADSDARLFLWVTNRYLPDALSILAAWRFAYRQTLVWHKRDANVGGSIAPNAEFCLVAVKGHPPRLARFPNAVIETSAPKQHSRKPAVFFDHVERVSPAPYVELFARQPRFGWDTWGWGYEDAVPIGAAER